MTTVNVLSSPELLVVDNQPARLQVGDVVPYLSQTSQSTLTPNAPVISSIQYQQTGVVIEVTPRVNSGGLVTLDVMQNVSDVARGITTQGINSPTFQERSVVSRVVVQDGQTIGLAGLIRDNVNANNAGIPWLKDVPILGAPRRDAEQHPPADRAADHDHAARHARPARRPGDDRGPARAADQCRGGAGAAERAAALGLARSRGAAAPAGAAAVAALSMPGWWLPLLLAPFVGSFAGLLVRRLPRGEPVAWARSRCEACGHALGLAELVPLASFAALGGLCRWCRAPIARRHLAIELACLGIAGWAVLASPDLDVAWLGCVLGWTLLALAWIDWEHLVLPDVLTLPLALAGLGATWWLDADAVPFHAAAAIAGYLAFRGVELAYRLLRGRDGPGRRRREAAGRGGRLAGAGGAADGGVRRGTVRPGDGSDLRLAGPARGDTARNSLRPGDQRRHLGGLAGLRPDRLGCILNG